MSNKKVVVAETENIEEVKIETTPKWKTKECHVVNYIPSHGILGFDFDGIGCQINVEKNLNIGATIKIQYQGEIGKDIKFKL